MPTNRAIFFDFGGTLFDYATLRSADLESLVDLVRSAGIEAKPSEIQQTYRKAMGEVFRRYVPRPFYLHRELFNDALTAMLTELGADARTEQLERFRSLQWRLYARDLRLREGVASTLKELHKRGLRLGIVSNVDEDQLSHLLQATQLDPYFDFVLSSEQAKSCKPDTVIFAEALLRAGYKAEEAIFVGDSLLQDIVGANQAGIRSVLLWHRDDRKPRDTGPRPCYVIRRIPELLALV